MFIPEPVATMLPDGSVRHPIITVCGSTRFKEELIAVVGELTDAIYVVNKDGYIGESTANEIRYAQLWLRPVYYMEGGAEDGTNAERS